MRKEALIVCLLFIIVTLFCVFLVNSVSAKKSVVIVSGEPIPLNIFQTWKTKVLPPGMATNVRILKERTPGFSHFLFDDNDCETFIRRHFGQRVTQAYLDLIPGAYKADLWRCCVLYIHGGVYLDIKMCPEKGLDVQQLLQKDHLVFDYIFRGIHNSIMICHPQLPFLKRCIDKIVDNVEKRWYGRNSLHVTGPCMMSDVITEVERRVF